MRSICLVASVPLLAFVAAVPACTSTTKGPAPTTAPGPGVDGPDGVSIRAPAGAIPDGVTLQIAEAAPGTYPADKSDFVGKVYAFTPHGTRFNSSVNVVFPVPAGHSPASLTIWRAEPGKTWTAPTPFATFDGANLTLSTDGFSFFAVANVPCALGSGCDGGGAPSTFVCPGAKDPTVTAGTASLGAGSGATYGVAGYGSVILASLGYGCAVDQGSQKLSLYFAEAPDYCQYLAAGIVIQGQQALRVNVQGWSGSALSVTSASVDLVAFAQTSPPSTTCTDKSSDTSGTGANGPAVSLTVSGSTVSGSLHWTSSDSTAQAITGTFTALPVLTAKGSCCQ